MVSPTVMKRSIPAGAKSVSSCDTSAGVIVNDTDGPSAVTIWDTWAGVSPGGPTMEASAVRL